MHAGGRQCQQHRQRQCGDLARRRTKDGKSQKCRVRADRGEFAEGQMNAPDQPVNQGEAAASREMELRTGKIRVLQADGEPTRQRGGGGGIANRLRIRHRAARVQPKALEHIKAHLAEGTGLGRQRQQARAGGGRLPAGSEAAFDKAAELTSW